MNVNVGTGMKEGEGRGGGVVGGGEGGLHGYGERLHLVCTAQL